MCKVGHVLATLYCILYHTMNSPDTGTDSEAEPPIRNIFDALQTAIAWEHPLLQHLSLEEVRVLYPKLVLNKKEQDFLKLDNYDRGKADIRAKIGIAPLEKSWGLSAFFLAAKNGHLNVIEWMHQRFGKQDQFFHGLLWGTNPIKFAAGNGHLKVVMYLHTMEGSWTSKGAMDLAASNGHFEIVKWLHKHRQEGFTSAAMEGAVINGHFEIVKWLHEHGSEGCTWAAIEGAVSSGDLNMLQWLHENNRDLKNNLDLMLIAHARGYLHVLRWLSSE